MVDLAKLEAEALTALRQYQEALARELSALAPSAKTPAQKQAVEHFVITSNEAANIARQFQAATLKQILASAAVVKAILGGGASGH